MFRSNELERLVHEIAELNEAFFPTHIVITVLAVVFALWCYIRPGSTSSRLMKGLLAILYGIIAYGVTVCAFHLQGIYYTFTAVVHWGVSLLFVASIFKDEIVFNLPAQKDLRTMSVILTIYGIFVYPVVELFMGYTWPGIFVFGALCPTTVFTEGVIITAIPITYKSKVYKALLVLLSFGAVVCATRTILIGGIFDISYLASGIIGFYAFFKYQ